MFCHSRGIHKQKIWSEILHPEKNIKKKKIANEQQICMMSISIYSPCYNLRTAPINYSDYGAQWLGGTAHLHNV